MPLTNRPLFLHPRVMRRLGRPVMFTAEPGSGADVLESDAANLLAALQPLIEVLNLAGRCRHRDSAANRQELLGGG